MDMKRLFDMVFTVTSDRQRAISTEEFDANYAALKDAEQVAPWFEWFRNHMDVLELWRGEVVAMNADGEVFVYGAPDGYEIRLGYCNDGFTFLGTTTCLEKVGRFPIRNYPDIYWRFMAMRTADIREWLCGNKSDTTSIMSLSEQCHDLINRTRQGYMDGTITIQPDSQLKYVYAAALWVPAGAKWIAVDSTGEIYAYSDKPALNALVGEWRLAKGSTHRAWLIGKVSERTALIGGSWQDSLFEVSGLDDCGQDTFAAEDVGAAYRKTHEHKTELYKDETGRWVMRYGLWLWVPKWATHIAVDADGWVYVYDNKPLLGTMVDNEWDNLGVCTKVGVISKDHATSFWKTSLRTISDMADDTDEEPTGHTEEATLKGKVCHIPIIEMDYFGETLRFPERLGTNYSRFEYVTFDRSGNIWAWDEKPKCLAMDGIFILGGYGLNIGVVTDKALAERMWRDSLRKIGG